MVCPPIVSGVIRSVTSTLASIADRGEMMVAQMTGKAIKPATETAREIMEEANTFNTKTAERMTKLSEHDVVWLSEHERFGRELHVAPLSVAGLMREQVLAEHTTILTSATLTLGGSFESMASSVGL